MKSDGVALGTVVAQYLGLILAIVLYLHKYKSYNAKLAINKIIDIEPMKEFFTVNFDIFIRTLCLIFAFSFFTAKSAEFGEDILAVNTILMQLWMILSYGVDGFAFAAESLVGNYIGEKNRDKLVKVIKYCFYWGLGMGAILSVVYAFTGEAIVSLYTDKPELVALAMTFFIWTILAPIVNSACFIWDGIFIGATATKPMRNTMLVSSFAIFLPVYLLTKDVIGNHSLWVAMLAFMLMRGITLTFYAKRSVISKAV